MQWSGGLAVAMPVMQWIYRALAVAMPVMQWTYRALAVTMQDHIERER